MVEKTQAPGTVIAPAKPLRSGGARKRSANGFKYSARPGAGKIMAAADVDPSLEASERRIKLALGVTTQRLEEQALSGGLGPLEVDTLAKVAGVYRTLAVTAPPFDPSKLSPEDMVRLMEYLDKAK